MGEAEPSKPKSIKKQGQVTHGGGIIPLNIFRAHFQATDPIERLNNEGNLPDEFHKTLIPEEKKDTYDKE